MENFSSCSSLQRVAAGPAPFGADKVYSSFENCSCLERENLQLPAAQLPTGIFVARFVAPFNDRGGANWKILPTLENFSIPGKFWKQWKNLEIKIRWKKLE